MNPIEGLAARAEPVLSSPYILRTRRNHGLEHATIHILSRGHPRLAGRSSDSGFVLIGDVPTDEVESAVKEALERMRAGERELALHPNCGTNLVTAGFLATSLAWLGFAGAGWRAGWRRFPQIMIAIMGCFLLSKPLGMSLQRHFTTEGDPGPLQLVSVQRETLRLPMQDHELTLHRVVTRQS